jgi:K+ transporter
MINKFRLLLGFVFAVCLWCLAAMGGADANCSGAIPNVFTASSPVYYTTTNANNDLGAFVYTGSVIDAVTGSGTQASGTTQ